MSRNPGTRLGPYGVTAKEMFRAGAAGLAALGLFTAPGPSADSTGSAASSARSAGPMRRIMASEDDAQFERLTDVGSRLRAAREAQQLSLREIADTTKISVSALEALEENDVARLPGGIYLRGFIRSHADAAFREYVRRLTPVIGQVEASGSRRSGRRA